MMGLVLLFLWAPLVFGQGLPCPEECDCSFTRGADFKVDCSGRNLYELPDGIDPQTQILDLSNNNFNQIPERLSLITYLEELNISGNKIKALSITSLKDLESLDILDLSRNEISKWADINPNTLLQPARSLRVLNLSNNPLNDFSYLQPNQILISESLLELQLNNCGITGILGKSPFGGLTSLRRLSMTHNPIKRLHRLISPTLMSLDLSYCEMTHLGHEELSFLPSLKYLILSNNYRFSFNTFEPVISTSLKRIDLSFCNMNKIVLSGFINLEEAQLRGNMLRSLNAGDFQNNSFLITLDLSSNGISHIHKNTFEGLTSLQYLNLSVNVIPSINDETFIKTPNLTVLNLSRNHISSVGALKSSSVIHIDMSFCEILNFDSNSLKSLSSLLEINLSKNLITSIPDNLFSNSLQILDLSFNRLSSINNNTFSSLPELTTLSLSENRFTQTLKYYYFATNPKLSEISLNDNTWRCDCYEEDMKIFFEYLTREPPKVWNINDLICHSPMNTTGKNWLEACYYMWSPEVLSPNQRAMSMVLIVFGGFFVACFIILFIRRQIKVKQRALEEERERQAEAERDRRREQRMRREQEQQRNAPDPRDLVSPPSYEEALLMPKLDGSYHSLAGVGLDQKRNRKKLRRRTKSSGDLLEEEERSRSNSKRRRRQPTEQNSGDEPTENTRLPLNRSEGNLTELFVVHMHESDL